MTAVSSDKYLYSVPGRDEYRFYKICKAPDGNGWFVCWHTQTGEKHHPVKRLGCFETIEDAQPALDKLAVQTGMEYWQQYPEPTRSGITGEWVKANKK